MSFTRPRITLRTKLLLASLSLLVVPWLGYRYLQGLEAYLRTAQEQRLLDRATIMAAVLSGRDKPFTLAPPANDGSNTHLYVRPLPAPIQVDGYLDDWQPAADRRLQLSGTADARDLDVYYRLGIWQNFLYLFFEVHDDHIVYRPSDNRPGDSDTLRINWVGKEGLVQRYAFSTLLPGRVTAQRLSEETEDDTPTPTEDPRIKAEWAEVSGGYNLEVRLPLDLLGNQFAFAITDVDDPKARIIKSVLGNGDTEQAEGMPSLALPAPEVEQLLQQLQQPYSRIWLVDTASRVVGLSDNMKADDISSVDEAPVTAATFFTGLLHTVYRLLLDQPTLDFTDHRASATHFDDTAVLQALAGKGAVSWRGTADERVRIITAAHPVYHGGRMVGAVAIEETSNSILILQNRAIEALMNMGLLAFVLTIGVLLAFATRLSLRVRRLRDQVEASIGPDGRVQGGVSFSDAGDELGDLGRSFHAMHERLAQYNRYLETMASKLSHELRTPITIVRSSLDNLDSGQTDDERRVYLQRAHEGVQRLSGILTRMSEATRLEQTIQQEEIKPYVAADVVAACVDGYRLAHPQRQFTFDCAPSLIHVTVHGSPELLAQLLDKLISNALDFAKPDTAIAIALTTANKQLVLSVSNEGPRLPVEMRANLFDSMVSLRPGKGDQPHLGLGLYIVRLIAEYHHGHVEVDDLPDRDGVIFRVILPVS
ncbi:MAG: proteobacterial dedicated sortase system histidine kinase [Pseudomonadota bacterium]